MDIQITTTILDSTFNFIATNKNKHTQSYNLIQLKLINTSIHTEN